MTIAFFVAGHPKGQPRPRAVRRGAHAGVYDPGTADAWKSAVRDDALRNRPSQPMDGPVAVSLTFIIPRAKSRVRKATAHLPLWHDGKPDADNLAKAVLDALTPLGFFGDDAQVVRLTTDKRSAAQGERTGCHIVIHPAPQLTETAEASR